MSAGKFDITVEQGATFSLPLVFNNEDGTPMDVSLWQFAGQIKDNYSDPTALVSFSFTAGSTTNMISVTIPAASTAMIPVDLTTNFQVKPTLYCYDIKALLPDTTVMRVMEGAVKLIPAVTV
jgi:hypothetical protein